MAKSTRTIGYSINGILDLEGGVIVKPATKEGEVDKVYPFTDIVEGFDGKEITFTIKETSELESVE
jgi:hypothetical protein